MPPSRILRLQLLQGQRDGAAAAADESEAIRDTREKKTRGCLCLDALLLIYCTDTVLIKD